MKTPKTGTSTFRIFELLYECGPMTIEAIVEKIGTSRATTLRILNSYFLKLNCAGTYALTYNLTKFFDDREVTGSLEIVPARLVSNLTPAMTGYTARMLRAASTRDDAGPIGGRPHYSGSADIAIKINGAAVSFRSRARPR